MNLHPVLLPLCHVAPTPLSSFLRRSRPTVSGLWLTIQHKHGQWPRAYINIHCTCACPSAHLVPQSSSGHVTPCHALTCFLSHTDPSASSCATDMKPSSVISVHVNGWGVAHGRWSASPPFAVAHADTCCTRWRLYLCLMCIFDRVVTSATHTGALPCQDKTTVVKQSKQSPLTAATAMWCDLQTGFLLPSLAILWQAQETHSAVTDKKLDQKKKEKKGTLNWMLNPHIQETAILSHLLLQSRKTTGKTCMFFLT